jgi:hypothetical protein
MSALRFEPLIRPEDMQDQSDCQDLEEAVDEHRPRDELPLLSSCSRPSRPLSCLTVSHGSLGSKDEVTNRDGGR